MKKITLLAAALLTSLVLSGEANARHRHHHYRHHHRHHHGKSIVAWRSHRVHAHRHVQPIAWKGMSLAAPSPMLAIAERYLGRGRVTPWNRNWCRDFVNMVMTQAGYHLRNTSGLAIEAVHLGTRVRTPKPGDLVVMRHHVTFFAGYGGRGVLGVGGNQKGRRVSLSSYPFQRIVAYVRPYGA